MKNNTTLYILFLLVTTFFYGQHGHKHEQSREKIISAKISFISDEISLTPEQAEKFWPVYKSLKSEIYTLFKAKRNLEKNIDYKNVSEEEAKVLVEKIIAMDQKIDFKKSDFIKQLSKILNNRQLLILNHAEHKFKKNLLERIKKDD